MAYSPTACIAFVIAFGALNWITVILRGIVRISFVRKFWFDDALSFLAICMKTILDVFFLDGLFKRNLARHITSITSTRMAELALRDLYLLAIFHILASCFIKLSFALTLFRFLVTRPQRLVVYTFMFIIVGFSIGIFFYRVFVCWPVPYVYETALDPYMILTFLGRDPAAAGLKPKGHCHSIQSLRAAEYSTMVWVIAIDLGLGVVLPVWLLKGSNLPPRLKAVSGLLLGLGALASVATMTRLSYMHLITTYDYTYFDAVLGLWASAEIDLCIIATNIATLRPLATRLAIFADSSGRGTPRLPHTNKNSNSRLQMRRRARRWLNAEVTGESGLATKWLTANTSTTLPTELHKSTDEADLPEIQELPTHPEEFDQKHEMASHVHITEL